MIAIFDVQYYETSAHGACVLVDSLTDKEPKEIVTLDYPNPLPYESGAFYKRELPVILALLGKRKDISLCVVDGYVGFTSDHHGLGYHLWKETGIPVIGVAKTRYLSVDPSLVAHVFRGNSKNPLEITAIGISLQEAKEAVQKMDGSYRIPTLIKLTDKEARSWLP